MIALDVCKCLSNKQIKMIWKTEASEEYMLKLREKKSFFVFSREQEAFNKEY